MANNGNGSEKADIGVMGLAVMGQNLMLNMNDNGFKVSVYNRTKEKIDRFLENEAEGTEIIGAYSIEEVGRVGRAAAQADDDDQGGTGN